MIFTDPRPQKCCDGHLAEAAASSNDFRHVRALLATHDMFQVLEGPHSSRVREMVEPLLLPGLRPGLRQWHQRTDAMPDRAAVELRNHLSQLAGERFGLTTEIPRTS